jgi:flagellar hook assembly protein FlgD
MVPVAGRVTLNVYDISGRQVAQLVNGQNEAGQHQVTFDGTKLTSGVYLYTLTAGSQVASGKLALVK